MRRALWGQTPSWISTTEWNVVVRNRLEIEIDILFRDGEFLGRHRRAMVYTFIRMEIGF